MTLTPLLSPRQGLSCLADGMVAVHGLIDDLQALQTGVSDVGCLGEIDRARARLDGLRLRVIAAAKAHQVPAQEGLASTPDWVATKTRTGRADAVKATLLAEDLAGDQDPDTGAGRAPLVGTRTALDAGALSAEHARVIADALRKLPAALAATTVPAARPGWSTSPPASTPPSCAGSRVGSWPRSNRTRWWSMPTKTDRWSMRRTPRVPRVG